MIRIPSTWGICAQSMPCVAAFNPCTWTSRIAGVAPRVGMSYALVAKDYAAKRVQKKIVGASAVKVKCFVPSQRLALGANNNVSASTRAVRFPARTMYLACSPFLASRATIRRRAPSKRARN